jgi:predicted aldo/keto reductase-like oxidoreductase
MQYREDPRTGNKLSILGFGCMRFRRGISGIDQSKAEKLIVQAIEAGVNYFDTAYLYSGSESALGEALKKNGLRDKVHIATKLPVASCRSGSDFGKFLGIQLEALKVEGVDYYLIHNITSLEHWKELCSWGIEKWIDDNRKAGKFKQLGFSYHGSSYDFLEVLDLYDWDFCQIQYNYSDENYQAGVAGLKKAHSLGIPVIVMEPLLGGKLAKGLPKEAIDVYRKANPSLTPAAWGLRWLWNQPEVTVVLSGMNEMEQLEDNLAAAEGAQPGMLSDEDLDAYRKVISIFKAKDKVPCTGCGYCMPCPSGINIPSCFASYNASFSHGFITSTVMYITSTHANRPVNGLASKCVKCGKCEKHCPQSIAIRTELDRVAKRMEPFYFNWGMRIMRSMNKPKSTES